MHTIGPDLISPHFTCDGGVADPGRDGFLVRCPHSEMVSIMLSYELSKLLPRKKVNAVPMSEALKAGVE
jgi:hypothetical protein